MRESRLEKDSKEWADYNGWLTMKYTGERGYPDRLFIKGGVTVWIEFKAPGKKPSIIQAYRIKKLKEAGALAFWAPSLKEVTIILNGYDPTRSKL